MTFILSTDGRDEDVVKAFEKYRNYLESNKDKFPKSAYQLAISDWYYNFNDPKCPHDAWLEKFEILEPSVGERNEIRETMLLVRLLGAYHDGYIELTYKNVKSLNINALNIKAGHSDWRYDEFRLSESGLLIHEIEWCAYADTAKWIIESEDIEYNWIEK